MFIKQIISLLVILWLAGCSNAVSYHHSERSSIALEVRTTDPQQPLQGIIGVKTRTIVVAPGMKGSSDKQAESTGDDKSESKGESTSVISDFNLQRKKSEDFFGFGSTEIQSAFITGAAAINAPTSTVKALSGLGIDGVGDSAIFKQNVLTNIYNFLESNQDNDEKSKKYITQLDKLLELLPENYVNNTYYSMSLSGKVLEKRDTTSYQPLKKAFLEVLNYEEDLLSDSILHLETMKNDRSIKYKASPAASAADINAADLAMLKKELMRLKKERREFFDMIGSHTVIDMAAAYMTSYL